MEMSGYEVEKDKKDFIYWFYSEGPRGRIRKIVKFQRTPELGGNVFNLAFGDFEESTGRMDDQTVSNNSDHLKVLHTVAKVVLEFINFWPNAIIWVKGSTSSRTRLYQMGISSFWIEITREFEVYGKTGQDWMPFKRGANYKEFLVFKKIK
jgi:hypothetical protein